MKKTVLLCATFILTSISASTQMASQQIWPPEICDPVPNNILSSPCEELLVVYNNFRKNYKLIKAGIEYIVCINDQEKIDYVTTSDKGFEIDHLKVGMRYSEIPKKLIEKERYVAGFSYEVKLKNGWEAHFLDQKIIDESGIYQEALITNFVKQDICQ